MPLGLIGKKVGMTRVFTDEGKSLAVTVVSIEENRVVSHKTHSRDGYFAVQTTSGKIKPGKINKPKTGHYKKAGVSAGYSLTEFLVEEKELEELVVGTVVELDHFKEGQKVDVSGTSKGKGFAGAVKRWNFSMQDATHGNSLSHRAPGSIGQCQTPGRVFKGKKMAGQLGNKKVTSQSLVLVRIDKEKSLMLIQGAVPGAPGSDVLIKPAVKAQ